MGRSVLPTVNVTASQKYSSSGFRRFKALREFQGRGPGGEMLGQPVWHDMLANKSYPSDEGWNQPPPDLPSGDAGRQPSYLPPSEAYRRNYATIDWGSSSSAPRAEEHIDAQ